MPPWPIGLNNRLKLEGERRLDKRHPGLLKIIKRVMTEYEKGRNTSISNEELERWSRRYLPEYFISEFDQAKAASLCFLPLTSLRRSSKAR